MVSGTISFPFRGAFHLSLTVLVHYRSLKVFSLGRWPGRCFPQSCRAPWYFGNDTYLFSVSNTRLSLSVVAPSKAFSYRKKINVCHPETPLSCDNGLGSSVFARRYLRNTTTFSKLNVACVVSFPPGTKMFQFSGLSSHGVNTVKYPDKSGWVFPFGNCRLIVIAKHLADTFAVEHASFIVFQRLGIHHLHYLPQTLYSEIQKYSYYIHSFIKLHRARLLRVQPCLA